MTSWGFRLEGDCSEDPKRVLAECFETLQKKGLRMFQARFYDGVREENWMISPPEFKGPPDHAGPPGQGPDEETLPLAQDANPESDLHEELVELGKLA